MCLVKSMMKPVTHDIRSLLVIQCFDFKVSSLSEIFPEDRLRIVNDMRIVYISRATETKSMKVKQWCSQFCHGQMTKSKIQSVTNTTTTTTTTTTTQQFAAKWKISKYKYQSLSFHDQHVLPLLDRVLSWLFTYSLNLVRSYLVLLIKYIRAFQSTSSNYRKWYFTRNKKSSISSCIGVVFTR